jgi:phosphatidyl-myo-inositol alpha-mannosyltransferase
MLRVAMVSPYSVSIPGGVQAQVMGLARELRRIGHEVRVLAPCDGPPPEPFVTPLGMSLPTAANGSVAPLAPDPSAALRTIRALNDEAFDIIHLHEPIAPGPTATALLLQLAPTVGTFHAAGDSSSYRVLNKTARWAADQLSTRVAVSASAKELAYRYLGGEYTILFNGIETDRYQRPEVERSVEPTIFFVGRHEPRKGLEVLLDAMPELPANARLWVASDGEGIDELKVRFQGDSRIEWLGRISEEEKLDRLARCTVFCAPSLRGESFGIVLLEAMAAGAALVASAIDGYINVATNEKDSLLVPPGDSRQLATAINTVLSDSRLRGELVTEGYVRAKQYSMSLLAEKYVDIYRTLLASEASNELQVRPNRLVSMFPDRLLRRPWSIRS